jgi:peptidyl-prolyl cis-trans isomerase A (cyclophilin A)
VPGLLAEVGDPLARGTGHAGYQIPDELDLRVRHDQPGVLAMASRGPNTSSSAFYITLQPAPWLDDRHTIFGHCEDLQVVRQIAQVPSGTVKLRSVTIVRRP